MPSDDTGVIRHYDNDTCFAESINNLLELISSV